VSFFLLLPLFFDRTAGAAGAKEGSILSSPFNDLLFLMLLLVVAGETAGFKKVLIPLVKPFLLLLVLLLEKIVGAGEAVNIVSPLLKDLLRLLPF
jgi:hypothetical protein